MASTVVQIRVDEDLKNEASAIFESIGLDLSTAFRVFLKKSVAERGIPFKLKGRQDKIMMKALKAMRQASKDAKKNGTANMTMEEIDAEIALCRAGK